MGLRQTIQNKDIYANHADLNKLATRTDIAMFGEQLFIPNAAVRSKELAITVNMIAKNRHKDPDPSERDNSKQNQSPLLLIWRC